MKASVTKKEFMFVTIMDGIEVGQGEEKGCQRLADELNADPDNAQHIYNLFVEVIA